MEINDRIREIRATLGLTQKEFGEKLSIAQSYLTNIETGKRKVTEKIQKLICLQFNVREEWLLTGNGDIFNTDSDDDMLNGLVERYNLDSLDLRIITQYLALKPYQRTVIKEYLRTLVSASTEPRESRIEEAENEYIKSISNSAPNRKFSASSTTNDTKTEKQA